MINFPQNANTLVGYDIDNFIKTGNGQFTPNNEVTIANQNLNQKFNQDIDVIDIKKEKTPQEKKWGIFGAFFLGALTILISTPVIKKLIKK